MKPAAFGYAVAENAAHAIEILNREGDDARPLAGGQSLVPMMNLRLARPSFLVDLNKCGDLDYVKEDSGRLRIGAMTRQRVLELSLVAGECCPLIPLALRDAGSAPIRNRGTVGGSIANGYPLADLITAALSLEAVMIVRNSTETKEISAEAFFVESMVTAVEPGELLTEIVVPIRATGGRYIHKRSGNHAGGAAIVIVSASADVREGRLGTPRIAVAGLAPRPIRLPNVESVTSDLSGRVALHDAFQADLQRRSYAETGVHADYAEELAEEIVASVVETLRVPPFAQER
jgi:carbon-monoxide dehydrogenase medium subunit